MTRRTVFALLGVMGLCGSLSARALDITAAWDDPNPPGTVARWEVQWRNPTTWNTATVTPGSTRVYTALNVQPGVFEVQVRGCAASFCSDWRAILTRAPSQPTTPVINP